MTVSPALLAGRYRLLDPLGTGGMGRVWLARDEVLHRDVAIKEITLPAELSPAERDELRVRTLREARTAARLSHPNVVQTYDVLGVDDRPWIVMEYVRSRSLQQILVTDGAIPPQWAAAIGLAVLRALRAAHAAGVLHRDVKPGNVLVAQDGRVVLTDFGLATFEGGESAVTRPGLVWGSPEYVAPERARHGLSSVETDLWSLGATLFAAVEGASPYARSSAMATLTALAVEKPPTPQRAGPLKPVLVGLLRKDPRARLRPEELERMLCRVAEPSTRPRPRRLPRQRPAPTTGATGAPAAGTSAAGVPVAISPYSLPEPPTDMILTPSAGPPPDVPPEAPRQARPRRRAWVVAIAAVVASAGVASVAVATAIDRQRPERPPVTAGPQPGTSWLPGSSGPADPGAAGIVTPAQPLPGENALPTGWAYHREAGQFRIAVPVGWRIQRDGRFVRFRAPGALTQLSVEVWPTPAQGALADTRERDRAWTVGVAAGSDTPPPGYRRLRLDPVVIGDGGAEWEYTYTDASTGTAMQVLSRRFGAGARCFGIAWTGPVYDSGSRRVAFDLAVGGFTPQSP